MHTINQKYIDLAKQYGVNLTVEIDRNPQTPRQEILGSESGYVIRLNPDKFLAELNYESYVAYNVKTAMLPNLVLETKRLRLRRLV